MTRGRPVIAAAVAATLASCQSVALRPLAPASGSYPSSYCRNEIGALLVDGGLFGGGLTAGALWDEGDYRLRALLFAAATVGAYSTAAAFLDHRGIRACWDNAATVQPALRALRAVAADGAEWGMCRFTDRPCDGELMCEDARMAPPGGADAVITSARTLGVGICVDRAKAHGPACGAAGACPGGMTCDPELRFAGHPQGRCVIDRAPPATP